MKSLRPVFAASIVVMLYCCVGFVLLTTHAAACGMDYCALCLPDTGIALLLLSGVTIPLLFLGIILDKTSFYTLHHIDSIFHPPCL